VRHREGVKNDEVAGEMGGGGVAAGTERWGDRSRGAWPFMDGRMAWDERLREVTKGDVWRNPGAKAEPSRGTDGLRAEWKVAAAMMLLTEASMAVRRRVRCDLLVERWKNIRADVR
jgi:hypothetical protein